MGAISLKYKSKSGNLTAPGDVDPGAMIPLATTTLSTATSTITFSNIPQVYEHLQIRMINQEASDTVAIQFNSDTGNNYSRHGLIGDGGAALAEAATSTNMVYVSTNYGSSGSNFGAAVIDILDYANNNKYKTVRSLSGADNNSVYGKVILYSGLWLNTNAITSIVLKSRSGFNLNTYTTATLYGIKRAGA